jgi:hypothetical protein
LFLASIFISIFIKFRFLAWSYFKVFVISFFSIFKSQLEEFRFRKSKSDLILPYFLIKPISISFKDFASSKYSLKQEKKYSRHFNYFYSFLLPRLTLSNFFANQILFLSYHNLFSAMYFPVLEKKCNHWCFLI